MQQRRLHKIKVAVYDSNKGYLDRLSKYLMSSDNYHFSINSFSDESYLVNFLNNNKVDIILISTDEVTNHFNLKNAVMIYLIGDKVSKGFTNKPYIYKYQSAMKIEELIIKHYSVNTNNEMVTINGEKGCELIGVYSPVGGCGKTIVSYALAEQLAEKGYKTLFLSLEEFPSYSYLLNKNHENSFSDLLYHVGKKTENLMMKLEGIKGMIEPSKLDYIPPPIYEEDIRKTKDEDFIYLIQSIKKYSKYHFVIIDFTSHYSNRNQQLYSLCDYPILLTSSTNLSISKVERFIKQKIAHQENEKIVNLIVNETLRNKNENIDNICGITVNYKLPYVNNIDEFGVTNNEESQGFILAINRVMESIVHEKG